MTEVKIEQNGCTLSCYLSGEIDHHSAEEMRKKIDTRILAGSVSVLVLDFSAVSFMDSSGIGLILGRNKLVSALGGRAVVQGAPHSITRMLALAGISKIIECKGENMHETC